MADIHRLVTHLTTHFERPLVEVRIDQLPTLLTHRAQDHLVRLTQSCNCVVGEALGGVTFLLGTCLACILQSWRSLYLALIASVVAFLVGKGVEVAGNRVQLLLLLRRLRQQVADAIAGRLEEPVAAATPQARRFDYPLNSRDADELRPERMRQRGSFGDPERRKVTVQDAADVDRVIRMLWGSWKIPRMVVQIRDITVPDVERIQDRLVRLSAGYSYQLAGLLAFAAFVAGMTLIMRTPEEVLLWTLDADWVDFVSVLMATLLAGLLGFACEVLWIRWRLMRALRELRQHLAGSLPRMVSRR